MLYRFYIYDENILIPTVSETEEGFYVDIKPVKLIHVKSVDEWRASMG